MPVKLVVVDVVRLDSSRLVGAGRSGPRRPDRFSIASATSHLRFTSLKLLERSVHSPACLVGCSPTKAAREWFAILESGDVLLKGIGNLIPTHTVTILPFRNKTHQVALTIIGYQPTTTTLRSPPESSQGKKQPPWAQTPVQIVAFVTAILIVVLCVLAVRKPSSTQNEITSAPPATDVLSTIEMFGQTWTSPAPSASHAWQFEQFKGGAEYRGNGIHRLMVFHGNGSYWSDLVFIAWTEKSSGDK